jgi:hypothetical protein
LEKKKENFKNQFSLTLSLSLGAPAYPESSGEINSLSRGSSLSRELWRNKLSEAIHKRHRSAASENSSTFASVLG